MEDIHIDFTTQKPDKGCTVITHQNARVSVPVTVKPKVSAGDIKSFCCGEPKVTPSPYTISCKPYPDSRCSFVLTQNICIEIPIEFSADAVLSPPCIACPEPPAVEDKKC